MLLLAVKNRLLRLLVVAFAGISDVAGAGTAAIVASSAGASITRRTGGASAVVDSVATGTAIVNVDVDACLVGS